MTFRYSSPTTLTVVAERGADTPEISQKWHGRAAVLVVFPYFKKSIPHLGKIGKIK
jgi:hypothetical protein